MLNEHALRTYSLTKEQKLFTLVSALFEAPLVRFARDLRSGIVNVLKKVNVVFLLCHYVREEFTQQLTQTVRLNFSLTGNPACSRLFWRIRKGNPSRFSILTVQFSVK